MPSGRVRHQVSVPQVQRASDSPLLAHLLGWKVGVHAAPYESGLLPARLCPQLNALSACVPRPVCPPDAACDRPPRRLLAPCAGDLVSKTSRLLKPVLRSTSKLHEKGRKQMSGASPSKRAERPTELQLHTKSGCCWRGAHAAKLMNHREKQRESTTEPKEVIIKKKKRFCENSRGTYIGKDNVE